MEVAMADHQIIQALLTLLVAAELVAIQVTAAALLLTKMVLLVLVAAEVAEVPAVLQTQHLAAAVLDY
jgi:hypothetical protein